MEGCGQYALVHLCYSFLPLLLPCTVLLLQHRSFPRAAVPQWFSQEKPTCASAGLFSGCCVGLCLNMVSPMRCKSTPGLIPREPPPSFSHAGTHTAVFSLFLPLLLTLPWSVLPPLKYVFTEVPPAWLMGSVVSYGGSAVEPAVLGTGQSLIFSCRGHP